MWEKDFVGIVHNDDTLWLCSRKKLVADLDTLEEHRARAHQSIVGVKKDETDGKRGDEEKNRTDDETLREKRASAPCQPLDEERSGNRTHKINRQPIAHIGVGKRHRLRVGIICNRPRAIEKREV